MNLITILIFVSIICIHQIYGHNIHKRLLDNSNAELPSKVLLNATNLEVPITSTTRTHSVEKPPEPKSKAVTHSTMQNWSLIPSTEAPEILVHPFVEETEVHQFNESDFKGHPEEKPQTETKVANSSKPGGTLSILNIISKPSAIVKEDCTCFSIHRPSPNAVKNAQKFENSTTSILSEVESEMGVLFEIAAAGGLPKVVVNETLTVNNTSQEISPNDETPFFEEFIPFVSLESLFSRVMPQETIIIHAESSGVEPLNLGPKAGADLIQNGTDFIKIQADPTTTQKTSETMNDKKLIAT